jgi:hypothetical protein
VSDLLFLFNSVTILRKVGDQAWQVIANEVHTPYIDSEKFDLPVLLLYKAIFQNVRYCGSPPFGKGQ